MVAGQRIWLIDHELTFPQGVVGSIGLPWDEGGLQWLQGQGSHIFFAELSKRAANLKFGPVRESWLGISDGFVESCRESMPQEWKAARNVVDYALRRVREARVNVEGLIAEVWRVLK